jgi:hypothetical protein
VPKTYFKERKRQRERESRRGKKWKGVGRAFKNEAGSLFFLPGSYPS